MSPACAVRTCINGFVSISPCASPNPAPRAPVLRDVPWHWVTTSAKTPNFLSWRMQKQVLQNSCMKYFKALLFSWGRWHFRHCSSFHRQTQTTPVGRIRNLGASIRVGVQLIFCTKSAKKVSGFSQQPIIWGTKVYCTETSKPDVLYRNINWRFALCAMRCTPGSCG